MLARNHRNVRIGVSILVGLFASAMFALSQHLASGHSDFSVVWYSSKLLFEGKNPYELIGPGRAVQFDWRLHYPASTLVAVYPLSLLSERTSDFVFVFTSTFLLAYGALRENLNRIWIFASAAFVVNAKANQWSALIGAGYFLPFAAIFICLKPSDGLAVLAAAERRKTLIFASASVVILLTISLFMMPDWPQYWRSSVTNSWEFVSPIMRTGGFVLLLSAVRWRTREGRFLLVLSLVPQVQSWYSGLLPLLVARTKRENQVLSLVSSLGYILLIPLAMQSPTHEISSFTVGRMMIAFCYLPALIAVLRK